MHTWYKAVCDEHKEASDIFVKSVSYTAHILMDRDQEIFDFLGRHYGCKLRLVHLDTDLDELWDEYTVDGKKPKKKLEETDDESRSVREDLVRILRSGKGLT